MKNLTRWRVLRYGLAICMLLCLGVGIWMYMHPLERCDKWEKVLSNDKQNPSVFLIEEGCSGFSNGAAFSIDIPSREGGRQTVFKYTDASWNAAYKNQTTPYVEWVSPNNLKISIGVVESVEVKLAKLDDLKISYDIGRVLKN
jgi:hypothetical protein